MTNEVQVFIDPPKNIKRYPEWNFQVKFSH